MIHQPVSFVRVGRSILPRDWLQHLRRFFRAEARDDGQVGEEHAGRLLKACGWQILDHRFRVPGGELDLVCEDEGTLVFVEVKTTRSERDVELRVDATKRKRLARAARAYVRQHKREEARCRFDIVTIRLDEQQNCVDWKHWADAFAPRDWGD